MNIYVGTNDLQFCLLLCTMIDSNLCQLAIVMPHCRIRDLDTRQLKKIVEMILCSNTKTVHIQYCLFEILYYTYYYIHYVTMLPECWQFTLRQIRGVARTQANEIIRTYMVLYHNTMIETLSKTTYSNRSKLYN